MKKIFFLTVIIILITGVALLLFNTAKINKEENLSGLNKIQVTASFYPLYYLVSEIGGEKVETYNLTPSGSEPHDYEPTAQDIGRMEKSKIVFINGGGLEVWGEKMVINLKDKNVTVVEVGKDYFTENREEEGKTVKDVHVWLLPELYKKEAAVVLNSLREIDPQNRDYYQIQANKLFTNLDKLQADYQKGLSVCFKKDIITSHAAFGYLAKAYGLNQVSIAGFLPESEPSAKQMAEVIKFARNRQVKYIFFESLVSPKLSETIANEVGVKTLVLDPLEGISDEEMGKGTDYFSVMENNLKNIKLALECKS